MAGCPWFISGTPAIFVEQLRRLRGWHQLCLATWLLCADATVLRDMLPRLQVAKLVDSDEANCILQRCLRLNCCC